MNPDDELAIAEAATPGPWLAAIKPNGKGVGLVGVAAKRGMGAQGCIAVIQSLPGGSERVANTKLIAHARTGYPLALEVVKAAQAMSDAWNAWMEDDEDDRIPEAEIAAIRHTLDAFCREVGE